MYILAYLTGILFNINPSCGSASLIWLSTQKSRWRLAALALTRISVFAIVGAIAGMVGVAARLPWGLLMIGAGIYILYTTGKQLRTSGSSVCLLPKTTTWLPFLLALVPPPSAYIGLALFFGGFNVPSAVTGALTLAVVGFGLTTPVWLTVFHPRLRQWWLEKVSTSSRSRRFQVGYQLLGSVILIIIGTLFVTLNNFHRPLVELAK